MSLPSILTRKGWAAFAVLAVAVVGVPAAGLRLYRAGAEGEAPAARFEVREQPVGWRPDPLPDAVSDAELRDVLRSVRPCFDRERLALRVPLSLTLHALRLWGKEARFSDDLEGLRLYQALDGPVMCATLLDHRLFARTSQAQSAALLLRSPYGIQALCTADAAYGARETSTHFGKLGQVMAEVGVPSARPVRTADGSDGTLREVLQDDAARVVAGAELDFVACGLARYAQGGTPWLNRFGQPRSLDFIANELLAQPAGQGSCGGGHAPHALTTLLRVNEQVPILKPQTREAVKARLARWSAALARCQRPDGSWDRRWPAHMGEHAKVQPRGQQTEFVATLLVTGHHLEWMALAPPDCRPPDDSLRMAARFLVRSWPQARDVLASDWHDYGLVSHAARALWLLSGRQQIQDYASPPPAGSGRAGRPR